MSLQMTTAIAIEDVRREVKILRALTGHKNLVQFYDAYEDDDNVYVVMEYVRLSKHSKFASYFVALSCLLTFPFPIPFHH